MLKRVIRYYKEKCVCPLYFSNFQERIQSGFHMAYNQKEVVHLRKQAICSNMRTEKKEKENKELVCKKNPFKKDELTLLRVGILIPLCDLIKKTKKERERGMNQD